VLVTWYGVSLQVQSGDPQARLGQWVHPLPTGTHGVPVFDVVCCQYRYVRMVRDYVYTVSNKYIEWSELKILSMELVHVLMVACLYVGNDVTSKDI
jgi:hypothetical protein